DAPRAAAKCLWQLEQRAIGRSGNAFAVSGGHRRAGSSPVGDPVSAHHLASSGRPGGAGSLRGKLASPRIDRSGPGMRAILASIVGTLRLGATPSPLLRK